MILDLSKIPSLDLLKPRRLLEEYLLHYFPFPVSTSDGRYKGPMGSVARKNLKKKILTLRLPT